MTGSGIVTHNGKRGRGDGLLPQEACRDRGAPLGRSEVKPSDPTDVAEWVAIPTLEGTMRAEIGDWIIRGVKGEFYPCKPDIFEATYEPADAMLAAREAGDE